MSENKWSVRALVDSVEKYIDDLDFPQMEQPEGFGKSYDYPSDITDLTSIELGNLQSRLTGFYSWCLKLLGKEETRLSLAETIYELRIWNRIHEELISFTGKKTPTEKMLKAKVIMEDEALGDFTRAILESQARVNRLKNQAQIYSEQLTKLSREQSRRDSESKVY